MWTNFTWILSALALGVLIVGIVSTIVVRIDNIPKWRTVGKILIWLVGITIFRLLVWDKIHNYKEERVVRSTPPVTTSKVNGLPAVQPKEEWVFEWFLPMGKIDPTVGRNRHILEVEITKNDQKSLWVVLHDKSNGADVQVGGLRLSKIGEDLIGSWSNYLDGDGGKCYLYKQDPHLWSGHYKLRDGSQTDCALKHK